MANIKDLIQSIEAADSSFDEKLAAINQMEETLVAMRAQEEQAVQDNVDLIVEAIKVMEKKVSDQLEVAKSIVPEKGDKGDKGDRGLDGKNGVDGKDGRDGINGRDGQDGQDGVSVTDAKIDFDGSLIITLSTGQEINVGEVVAPELQEKIKLVTSGGAGTVLPSQTGNANKYLKTDGTGLSWAAGDGTGTVTSVGGTGTVSGISLSGTVTTSGNLTLGGTLDLSSPPAIGGTTPAAGTFTTLTAQTEVLKGSGQNLLTYSEQLDNSIWTKDAVTVTANATTAPDGTSTADKVIVNNGTSTTGANNNGGIYQVPTTLVSTAYVYSFYAKAAELSAVKIRESNISGALASIDLTNGSITYTTGNSTQLPVTATLISNGWYRIVVAKVTGSSQTNWTLPIKPDIATGNGTSGVYVWGGQFELSTSVGNYISTTTTAVYGTPSLSFSGVAGLGLQSDGSLYVSPAGTGAIQAQATTSTATGGNARGANAVDWQTLRDVGAKVASGANSVVGGGWGNQALGSYSINLGGAFNNSNGNYTGIYGGNNNLATLPFAAVVNGAGNTAAGYYNFIAAGFTNSGTSSSAVTTQSGTMNATTAVTLSGSNANIKVGQYITGTSIANDTYVAAISGTSLTLSKNASGSSTSTLSFYTPHGVVVGGGNNQATGAYSFIGGGGDAGTAANRNTASGAWSTVAGGWKGTASGEGAFIGGGGSFGSGVSGNTASGTSSFVGAGFGNQASGYGSTTVGGSSNTTANNYSFIGGGNNNTASAVASAIVGGSYGTVRGITGMQAMPACSSPISGTLGITQAALLVLARETTNATATVLCSDGNAASGTNQVILPNNSAYYFRGEVVAGVTGAGNTKGWYVEGVIKRGANAASTALVGTPTVTSLYADAGAATWALTATADVTNGGLAITFTGQAATTIRVVCQLRTTEMTY